MEGTQVKVRETRDVNPYLVLDVQIVRPIHLAYNL